MEGKLIKQEKEYYALYNTEGIFISDVNGGSLANRLSLKNCEAIENGYDLDELVKEEHKYNPRSINEMSFRLGFEVGFQKALEILGDKKFSEDDVIYMIERSNKMNFTAKHLISNHKKTEWLVEIEMEFNPINHASGLEITGNELMDIAILENYKPKLDKDGCLILKRK